MKKMFAFVFQSLKGKVKQRQIVLSNILYTKCSPMSSKN